MATHDAGFLPPQSQSRSLASGAARRPTHATQAVIEMDTETRILLVEDSSDIVTSSVARLRRHPAAAVTVLRLHVDNISLTAAAETVERTQTAGLASSGSEISR